MADMFQAWVPTGVSLFVCGLYEAYRALGQSMPGWSMITYALQSSWCIPTLTHWSLADVEVTLQVYFSKSFDEFIFWSISCGIGLRWEPQNPTDDKSTLIHVMAWCHQASSHYSKQCWPIYLRPQGHDGSSNSFGKCWSESILSWMILVSLSIYHISSWV